MRVLITGITGMIGTHLADECINKGFEVAGISRATSSARFHTEKRVWNHYQGDILDVKFLERVIKEYKPDIVYHLAAQAYNGTSWEFEETTYLLNITGTRNVFSAIKNNSPNTRVIPACSSAEYGIVPLEMQPIDEDVTPLHPITPYGITKVACENIAFQHFKNYDMDIVIPRLFIHVGPNHPPSTALQTFAMQVSSIKLGIQTPSLMVGNLESTRDFVDVRDGAKALVLLAEKGIRGDVYNISTGIDWKISDCLNMMIEISGIDCKIEIDKSRFRPTDEPKLLGSNYKINKLGWKPKIDFKRTLTDILENWENRLEKK